MRHNYPRGPTHSRFRCTTTGTPLGGLPNSTTLVLTHATFLASLPRWPRRVSTLVAWRHCMRRINAATALTHVLPLPLRRYSPVFDEGRGTWFHLRKDDLARVKRTGASIRYCELQPRRLAAGPSADIVLVIRCSFVLEVRSVISVESPAPSTRR